MLKREQQELPLPPRLCPHPRTANARDLVHGPATGNQHKFSCWNNIVWDCSSKKCQDWRDGEDAVTPCAVGAALRVLGAQDLDGSIPSPGLLALAKPPEHLPALRTSNLGTRCASWLIPICQARVFLQPTPCWL